MQVTEQQIKERAQQIGDRPYYPLPSEHASWWGITIRQELMRTAMGGMLVNGAVHKHAFSANKGSFDPAIISEVATAQTNALLLEMARQELGVGDE